MNSIQTYLILSKKSFDSVLNYKFPSNYKISPTNEDYKKGYVRRAFCLYINSGKIVELKLTDSQKFNNNNFLKIRVVKWKISGSERNVYKNNILLDKGVYETNMETMNNLENDGFKNIKNFLYPLNFYKNKL